MNLKFVYYKKTGQLHSKGECNIDQIPGCRTPKDYGNHLNRHGLLPGIQGGKWFGIFTIEIPDSQITNNIECITPNHKLMKFLR